MRRTSSPQDPTSNEDESCRLGLHWGLLGSAQGSGMEKERGVIAGDVLHFVWTRDGPEPEIRALLHFRVQISGSKPTPRVLGLGRI